MRALQRLSRVRKNRPRTRARAAAPSHTADGNGSFTRATVPAMKSRVSVTKGGIMSLLN